MAFVTWKFDRYARSGDTWSPTGVTLSDIYDPIVSVAVGASKDSFSFKIANFNGNYNNYFQPRDKIVISRVVNSTTVSTSDVIMTGAINAVPTEHSGTSNEIRIQGYNFSEALADAITFFDAINLTPPQIIQAGINGVRSFNENLSMTWDSANKLVKVDGSAFPTYSKTYNNVPLRQVIEENSSSSRTQDGSYKYWVTPTNMFKWMAVNEGSSTSLTFNATTDEYITYKDNKDLNGIKNFIILKGGNDCANRPIQQPYRDYASINKHGNKFYYAVSQKNQGDNLIQQDLGTTSSTTRYPSSYPFTTRWYKINTNTRVTVANDSEYNAAIRAEVKDRLTDEAKAIVEITAKGKLQIDLAFIAGTKTWQLNDRVNCTIPSLSSAPKILRVVEIQYTSEIDTFSLEEDIGTL